MEKKDSQSKQQELLKKIKIVPYVRYNKKTEEWTMKAKLIENSKEIIITMERKQLDSIAKIVAYLYHDEREKYIQTTSETRKGHIYKDLEDINQWLTIEYKKLKELNEKKR